MWFLITARCYADLADNAIGILAFAKFGIGRMASRPALWWELPVVTFVIEHIIGPRLLNDANSFFKKRPVPRILLVTCLHIIRGCSANPFFYPIRVDPTRMIAAREAAIQSALQHMVKCRDLFGNAHRIVRRHGVTHNSGLHALTMLADKQTEHAWMIIGFKSFNLKVVLWLAVAIETQLICMLHVTAHFFQKALIQFRSPEGTLT